MIRADTTPTVPSLTASFRKRGRSRTTASLSGRTGDDLGSESSFSAGKQKVGDRRMALARDTTPRVIRGMAGDVMAGADRRAKIEIPEEICELIDDCSGYNVERACMPKDLEDRIRTSCPKSECIPPHAWKDESLSEWERRWTLATAIYDYARQEDEGQQSEMDWYQVVEKVFEESCQRINDNLVVARTAQTKALCEDVLPVIDGRPVVPVKVDMSIQFNQSATRYGEELVPWLRGDNPTSLSPFSDTESARTFTAALVEVKQLDGSYAFGAFQLSLASAAVIVRMNLLFGDASGLPVISWLVQGHFWHLYMAYQESKDVIVGQTLQSHVRIADWMTDSDSSGHTLVVIPLRISVSSSSSEQSGASGSGR